MNQPIAEVNAPRHFWRSLIVFTQTFRLFALTMKHSNVAKHVWICTWMSYIDVVENRVSFNGRQEKCWIQPWATGCTASGDFGVYFRLFQFLAKPLKMPLCKHTSVVLLALDSQAETLDVDFTRITDTAWHFSILFVGRWITGHVWPSHEKPGCFGVRLQPLVMPTLPLNCSMDPSRRFELLKLETWIQDFWSMRYLCLHDLPEHSRSTFVHARGFVQHYTGVVLIMWLKFEVEPLRNDTNQDSWQEQQPWTPGWRWVWSCHHLFL